MTDIQFGRLKDLPLREAWKHEAQDFTPWLADNIDHLSEVIGIPMELTDTEVAVETFSADILAQNMTDGSVVLIENQLETTDHTHLGQIMTYLAGLEAQTVVWIAPSFREPHLSAIRWLNEHTADGFSFFAIKVRVVRIGDSPYAPVFEVVEKPSKWERSLQSTVRPQKSQLSLIRGEFWSGLLRAFPDLAEIGVTSNPGSNKWLQTKIPGVVVGIYVASNSCGIYVRGDTDVASAEVAAKLVPVMEELLQRLGVPPLTKPEPDWLFTDRIGHPLKDQRHWQAVWDWMAPRATTYVSALNDLASKVSV